MKKAQKIRLELLAPAKNADIAIEAVKHGADAVYMGASRFGARSSAGNELAEIKKAVDFAHNYNARIYVTINTIIFENELKDVETLIHELYKIGVDALIVQDMGILRLNLPPISLHASTQCDLRTTEKAEFLEEVGFSQLVMARELTLDEIRAIRNKVNVPLEAFIHGALCVSYSGRCGMSYACMKRSANRGECAQICRLPYSLVDEKGNVLVKNKHLLSLKDMNQSSNLREMIDAGVSSFKIEGRLKDVDYVKTVVAYYNRELDRIVAENPDRYERGSKGVVEYTFNPDLYKVFNRSFTSYFLKNRTLMNGESIASINTPKSIGEYVGKVISANGNRLKISTTKRFANGDGISYFDENDEYAGFRVNRVENDTLICSQSIKIAKGTKLYRTFDKSFNDVLVKDTAVRKIRVSMGLRYHKNTISLDMSEERDNQITVSCALDKPLELAKTEQSTRQAETLQKLGNTIYLATDVTTLGNYFIPNSVLADLRRLAVEKMDAAQRINYKYEYRKPENKDFPFYCESLTHVDNVANSLSESFYQEHGVKKIVKAIESPDYKTIGDEVLMHTRYCILRELDYCRKDKKSAKLSQKLYLVNDRVKMLVETDCLHCEMKLRKC